MKSAVLKVSHQDEVRRCHIEKEQISYGGILDTIATLFPNVEDFKAKYFDEEGDACTFCKASVKDFLEVSAAKKASSKVLLLKLELTSQDSLLERQSELAVGAPKAEVEHSQAPVEVGASDGQGEFQGAKDGGQRLGGMSIGTEDLRKKALEAAESRQSVSAELALHAHRQDLQGRIAEQYRRLGEDMPMGLGSSRASPEQLCKHLEKLRLRPR
mmetsp:Transcript_27467/g.49709  ORF Transcript_27467/g.49709 Transcript_27467/m.49709 type:complete len:214 (-) Transcript_27467:188-829(-)|eukprot:CAMPEP_0197657052 /NCGR_PEP_ID=MMETSP1338-20131121/44393_1 /TAXON_ID=43686 ORGANISM="Pelagodinium beii, Strain RCC1491" /NCGR_SAMPLE_ID=MMETSP1338 /ASSEMBLY_ACC=CAM_ASM_000754 /LENGTH=213 /DNA_ID=CAMNT_0043233337 /DNA_START=80 /DNA_END=721 /DNA_ORIENTATION=-